MHLNMVWEYQLSFGLIVDVIKINLIDHMSWYCNEHLVEHSLVRVKNNLLNCELFLERSLRISFFLLLVIIFVHVRGCRICWVVVIEYVIIVGNSLQWSTKSDWLADEVCWICIQCRCMEYLRSFWLTTLIPLCWWRGWDKMLLWVGKCARTKKNL
jgi:hypothetical protein